MKIADRSFFAGQFVILRHVYAASQPGVSHWDLMLELPGASADRALYTLQLDELPQDTIKPYTAMVLQARRLPDHRAVYLTYEGPISGNRGSVQRTAAGRYSRLGRKASPLSETDAAAIQIQLRSETVLAELSLKWSEIGTSTDLTLTRWQWIATQR